MRRLAALAFALLALSACSGSGTSPPPTASQLARKIPGCTHIAALAPAAPATGEVTCQPPSGAADTVEIYTFATMGDEKTWILRQGNWYGCCIQGHLWAADYNAHANEFPLIMKALGGQAVRG